MTPQEFIAKWQAVDLSERSACQQHFLDLCELLGQPKPAAADPDGEWYTFERGVEKTDGGDGWADVWMRGHFGWEYKGKKKDLKAAYTQLLKYRESLDNPPLLVVCDLNRFEIHTIATALSSGLRRWPDVSCGLFGMFFIKTSGLSDDFDICDCAQSGRMSRLGSRSCRRARRQRIFTGFF